MSHTAIQSAVRILIRQKSSSFYFSANGFQGSVALDADPAR
jgi:hypothetical protein